MNSQSIHRGSWTRVGNFALALLLGLSAGSSAAAVGPSGISAGDAELTVSAPGLTLDFPLTVDTPLAYDAYVTYRTQDGSAAAGTDYTATTGQVQIPAGATSAIVSVPVAQGGGADKTLQLILDRAIWGGASVPPVSLATKQGFRVVESDHPRAVAIGDLDGDGMPDLVAASLLNLSGPAGEISVLFSTTAAGAATPSCEPALRFPAPNVTDVAIGDIDGDGKPDLVYPRANGCFDGINCSEPCFGSTCATNPSVAVMFTRNASAFSGGAVVLPGHGPVSAVGVGDLNGDGRQDIVATGGGGKVFVVLNQSSGHPEGRAAQPIPDGATYWRDGNDASPDGNYGAVAFTVSSFVASGPSQELMLNLTDLNGDDALDLVVGINLASNNLRVYFGDGAGQFSAPTSYSVSPQPTKLAAGDLDGDGKPELMVVHGSGVSVLLNQGDGSLAAPVAYGLLAGTPTAVAVNDVNGDDHADVALTFHSPDGLAVLLGDGQGALGSPADFYAGMTAAAVAVGDFNGDGKADVVSANQDGNDVSVLLNLTDYAQLGTTTATGTLRYPPPPTVLSITRDGSSPTRTWQLFWTVTFDEAVSGVDVSDFELIGSATKYDGSGNLVTNDVMVRDVTGSGTTWTVEGAIDDPPVGGSLRLDLVDDDSIVADDDGQPLGGSGAGNGNLQGETYALDGAGPAVNVEQAAGQPDPTGGSVIHFTAVFGEAVADFDQSDVILGGPGGISATMVTVTDGGSGTAYDIAVSGMTAGGPVVATIAAGAAHDGAGNPSLASSSTDNTVNFVVDPDSTPDAFSFIAHDGVPLSRLTVSSTVTIKGIDVETAVSSSGGEFRVYAGGSWGPWITSGSIRPGGRVQLRHVNAATTSTATHSDLDIGGVIGRYTSITLAADADPDPFSFVSSIGVAVSTTVVSSVATIRGMNASAPASATGGELRIHTGSAWGPWVASGSIANGQRVQLRHTSAAAPSTAMHTDLTIGSVTGRFTSTTVPPDSTPDAFSFAPVSDTELSRTITSREARIKGINTSAPVSISGGAYRVRQGTTWGAWTSAAGSIAPGSGVQVRHTSSASPSSTTQTDLTIGGVTASFVSTTRP